MKVRAGVVLFSVLGLLAAGMSAQTSIGGGSCTSSTVNGIYAVSITGRQVTTAGSFTNVFQSNGSANFDGLSKVTFTLAQDTASLAGMPLTWSGNYSMQSNCAGVVNITSGGGATFNLVLYNGGTNFLMTGSDATYSYSGNGNTQPAGCSASTVVGVYTITGTGFSLSSGAVNGAAALSGLLQFDGQSNVTANYTVSGTGPSSTSTLIGTYSMSANCLGSAMLTDSKGGSYVMSISVFTATKVYSSAFYVDLAQNSKSLISGTAHAIYGQPSAAAAIHAPVEGLAAEERGRQGL
jgi:hypothetical protein